MTNEKMTKDKLRQMIYSTVNEIKLLGYNMNKSTDIVLGELKKHNDLEIIDVNKVELILKNLVLSIC